MEKLYTKSLDLSDRILTEQILNEAKTVGELILSCNEPYCTFENQLTAALRRNQTLTHFNLSRTTINDETASVLSENETITHLDLSHIYFSKGCIEKIVENKNLQYLTLIRAVVKFNSLDFPGYSSIDGFPTNKFPGEIHEIVKEVSTFLQETTSLKYLNFSDSLKNCEPAKKIFQALLINRSLTDLKLASNSIDLDCIQELTEMLKHNKTLQRLDLSRNKLNNAAMKEIAQVLLQNQTLTDINLSHNNISPGADAREFITLFLQNKNLIALNLSYNQLGDNALSEIATQLSQTNLTKLSIADNMELSLINQFASSLKHNNTLSSLSLGINLYDDETYNGWGDITDQVLGPVAVQKLTTALMTNQVLTFLDFSFYFMGRDGAKDVAEFLKHNKTLTDLNVRYNNIGSEGAKCIASALVVNKSLLNLNLGFNDIGTDGAVALWKALKVNRTLINLNIYFIPSDNLVGINDLVDVLRSNNILTTLDIVGYEMNTNIEEELTEALKENTTLLHLRVFPECYDIFSSEELKCCLERNRNLLRKISSIAKYVYTHRTEQELILTVISKKDLEEFEAYPGRHSMIKMLCESDFCVTEAAKVIDYTHYFIKNHFFVITGILEDPFSKLPLDILCNIASFLKLKDVRE